MSFDWRIKIEHSTSLTNLEMIKRSGGLRSGSYVTTHSISDMTPKQRVYSLCLDSPSKGECVCRCTASPPILKEPPEGTLTCRGLSQYQLKEPLPIISCSCGCDGDSSWEELGKFVIGGLILIGVLRAIFGRGTSN